MFFLFTILVCIVDLYYLFGLAWSWLSDMDNEDDNYDLQRRQFRHHIVSTGAGSKDLFEQVTDSFIKKTEWFYARYVRNGPEAGRVRAHFFLVLLANLGVLLRLLYLLYNKALINPLSQPVIYPY